MLTQFRSTFPLYNPLKIFSVFFKVGGRRCCKRKVKLTQNRLGVKIKDKQKFILLSTLQSAYMCRTFL